MIPLATSDGRGITRAKRANQESNKYPQGQVRHGFAGDF
jgi:hypothetical protein